MKEAVSASETSERRSISKRLHRATPHTRHRENPKSDRLKVILCVKTTWKPIKVVSYHD
jgi:hypothetical protein